MRSQATLVAEDRIRGPGVMIQSELCRIRGSEAIPVFVAPQLSWQRTIRAPAGAMDPCREFVSNLGYM